MVMMNYCKRHRGNVNLPSARTVMAVKNPFCHKKLKDRSKNTKIRLPQKKGNVRLKVKIKKFTSKKLQDKSAKKKK
jgi:hypothetical protein